MECESWLDSTLGNGKWGDLADNKLSIQGNVAEMERSPAFSPVHKIPQIIEPILGMS